MRIVLFDLPFNLDSFKVFLKIKHLIIFKEDNFYQFAIAPFPSNHTMQFVLNMMKNKEILSIYSLIQMRPFNVFNVAINLIYDDTYIHY